MTTDRASLKVRLETAGSAEVEPVAPRLEELEALVMSSIAVAHDDSAVVLSFKVRRQTTPARRLTLGLVAASLLAVSLLAAGWFTTGDESLVIAAADDVTVVYPDGAMSPGEVGLALPVGADVMIRGSMVVDGVTYGPGDYTITGDGVERLVEVDESSVAVNRDDEDAPTSVFAGDTLPATTIAPASAVGEEVSPPGDSDGPSRSVPSTATVELPDDRSTAEGDSDERSDLVPVTRETTKASETTATTRPPESTTTAPQDRPTTTVATRDRTDRSGD